MLFCMNTCNQIRLSKKEVFHSQRQNVSSDFSFVQVTVATILYSMFFTCSVCGRQIAACVFSAITISLYSFEVGVIRARPGEISGFLSTVPGLLKVLEAFVACIIFLCLRFLAYWIYPGLQWCVFVYSICFIFSFLVIILTVCRLLPLLPAPFKKVLTICNVLAVLLYITAVITWPVICFKNNPRPDCHAGYFCLWNWLVVISVMTCINLVAYIVDTVYSFKLSFITVET